MSEVNEEKHLALSTLCKICEDDSAPATARASAARTLLEVCGEIGRLQTEKPNENKGLHEMSRAELDAELRRLSNAVHKRPARARPNGKRPARARPNGADGSKRQKASKSQADLFEGQNAVQS